MTYIYDLETYPNYFLATFYNVKTLEYIEFEVSERMNQSLELYDFLVSKPSLLVGFNNINFDYPVLHKTILQGRRVIEASVYYRFAMIIIGEEYSSIWDSQTKIPQLDLFKLWHYDNKNKSCSLKWLEFAMRLENVEDLPYAPGSFLTVEQMQVVKDYCRNDVHATYEFYLKSEKHIAIREFYTKEESINLMSASEIRMSKEIFGKYLAREMRIPVKKLKDMRTMRQRVEISDVIFDYLKFNDPVNQETLDIFNKSVWKNTENMTKAEAKASAIKFTVPYKNVIREYAEGGLHSFGKPGIYESDDDYVLVDVDFASFYPHISFVNGLHPEHIPEKVFNTLYKGFYDKRKEFPKSDPRNYVLKIILNGSYGLSKDKYAFLYDPKWQLGICINGQLLLTLLTERVMEAVPEALILFENTDGAMYRIPRSKLDLITSACKEVEKLVGIGLDIEQCKKLIIRDVNNYINIINDDDVKYKGAFAIDRDWHKNHSKRIVPIAMANYFINNIPIEQTITNYLKPGYKLELKGADSYGIYDFCIGAKMKGAGKLYQRDFIDGRWVDKPLSKVTRYYVSTDGSSLMKILPPLEKAFVSDLDKAKELNPSQIDIFSVIEDKFLVPPTDRETNIESGHKCTVFNKYSEGKSDIKEAYYINECNKNLEIMKR